MPTKNILADWEKVTNDLSRHFVKRYFGSNADDVYWIGDEIGGCLAICDYFFSLSDMVDFLRCGYSKDKMFEYYDYSLANSEKEILSTPIKNWIKLK